MIWYKSEVLTEFVACLLLVSLQSIQLRGSHSCPRPALVCRTLLVRLSSWNCRAFLHAAVVSEAPIRFRSWQVSGFMQRGKLVSYMAVTQAVGWPQDVARDLQDM